MKKRILIAEDDADIAGTIEYNLREEGYAVQIAPNGLEALRAVRKFQPDLILLDVMMPGLDGLEVCKRLRADEKTSQIPILMLTARASDVDVVLGLELGADDYVTKPFSMRVLLARVRNILRRDEEATSSTKILRYNGMTLDRDKREAMLEGRPIPFSKTEFEIVAYLLTKPGHVFSRDQILRACWPDGVVVVDRAVDVHINAVRRKLGPLNVYLETVRGIGYRMKD